jgi:hypothetical protein
VTRGLPPPDPHSLSPLSSTEFVKPPLKKIPRYAAAALLYLLMQLIFKPINTLNKIQSGTNIKLLQVS